MNSGGRDRNEAASAEDLHQAVLADIKTQNDDVILIKDESDSDNSSVVISLKSSARSVKDPSLVQMNKREKKIYNAAISKGLSRAKALIAMYGYRRNCKRQKKQLSAAQSSKAHKKSSRITLGFISNIRSSPLTKDQMNLLQEAILKSTLSCSSPNQKPHFNGILARGNCLVLKCADPKSANWVWRNFRYIQAESCLNIKLLEENEFPPVHVIKGYFPNSHELSNDIVLSFIAAQNNISIGLWKVTKRSTSGTTLNLTINVDEMSMVALISHRGKIWYRFGTIKLNLNVPSATSVPKSKTSLSKKIKHEGPSSSKAVGRPDEPIRLDSPTCVVKWQPTQEIHNQESSRRQRSSNNEFHGSNYIKQDQDIKNGVPNQNGFYPVNSFEPNSPPQRRQNASDSPNGQLSQTVNSLEPFNNIHQPNMFSERNENFRRDISQVTMGNCFSSKLHRCNFNQRINSNEVNSFYNESDNGNQICNEFLLNNFQQRDINPEVNYCCNSFQRDNNYSQRELGENVFQQARRFQGRSDFQRNDFLQDSDSYRLNGLSQQQDISQRNYLSRRLDNSLPDNFTSRDWSQQEGHCSQEHNCFRQERFHPQEFQGDNCFRSDNDLQCCGVRVTQSESHFEY